MDPTSLVISLATSLKELVTILIQNPLLSILGGIILMGSKHLLWAIGVALVVWGVLSLATQYLGIPLPLPRP